MKTPLIPILSFALLIMLTACHKDDDVTKNIPTGPDSTKLSCKLTVRVQGTDSTFFKYNDKGLVIQVQYKLSYLTSTSTITYNSSDKLTSIISSDPDVTSQLYEYSDDGKTCKMYTVNSGIKTLNVTNSFDDNGFLVKSTSPNTAYTRYEYDSNGNFAKEYVSISNGEYLSSVITYDDKKSSPLPFNSTIFVANPYSNSHSAVITSYLPSSEHNKNNQVHFIYYNSSGAVKSTFDQAFVYNAAGYPRRFAGSAVNNFIYECD